jgi:hypothetical protein
VHTKFCILKTLRQGSTSRKWENNETNFLRIQSVELYEGVSRIFRTGHLERELQMVQLSATRCSCIAAL